MSRKPSLIESRKLRQSLAELVRGVQTAIKKITLLDHGLVKNVNRHSFVVTCPRNILTRNWLFKKKRAIATLETFIKLKISQELTARQTALSRVTNSVNKNVEEVFVEELPDDYAENNVRNWLRIQQDVAYVKKHLKSGAVPSREMVRSVIKKKNED